jgi:hypothetical protein
VNGREVGGVQAGARGAAEPEPRWRPAGLGTNGWPTRAGRRGRGAPGKGQSAAPPGTSVREVAGRGTSAGAATSDGSAMSRSGQVRACGWRGTEEEFFLYNTCCLVGLGLGYAEPYRAACQTRGYGAVYIM